MRLSLLVVHTISSILRSKYPFLRSIKKQYIAKHEAKACSASNRTTSVHYSYETSILCRFVVLLYVPTTILLVSFCLLYMHCVKTNSVWTVFFSFWSFTIDELTNVAYSFPFCGQLGNYFFFLPLINNGSDDDFFLELDKTFSLFWTSQI
jgi:hypothetical protein